MLRPEQLRRDCAARRERVGQVNFRLDPGERSGKLVAELEQVSKGYRRPHADSGFTSRWRGDRIGLIGRMAPAKPPCSS